MEVSVILNWILGGGLLAAVIGLVTLKATVLKANAEAKRAKAEAEKAEADAESVRIDNAEHATRILMENIVKPLKDEFTETKDELSGTKKELARNTREMARLRKALDGANSCEHRDGCPVLDRLREQPKEHGGERTVGQHGSGQHGDGAASADAGTGAAVPGAADTADRQRGGPA